MEGKCGRVLDFSETSGRVFLLIKIGKKINKLNEINCQNCVSV
jgi:hypothetical protein